eukprot:CAMPEP_0170536944 /NCGR_PEP_ID=MMETSP0209-20121228/102432_1 /TAXON_ID=665100 ORGANISM="Litonotus pictus, Strain P1" /NCGR_SAMPLE_ID=MMETSP0209 /ASSEMBLY_ACC=CAM_ASM_000301 /LENGTH=654 /DNA_ID=CAMNT_0010838371 /DNA_START=892 /DNA_END=2857 /DNA_ORIENTATION=+
MRFPTGNSTRQYRPFNFSNKYGKEKEANKEEKRGIAMNNNFLGKNSRRENRESRDNRIAEIDYLLESYKNQTKKEDVSPNRFKLNQEALPKRPFMGKTSQFKIFQNENNSPSPQLEPIDLHDSIEEYGKEIKIWDDFEKNLKADDKELEISYDHHEHQDPISDTIKVYQKMKRKKFKQKNRYKNTVGTEDQEIIEKKERDDSAEKYSIENMIERNLEDINWKLKKLETLNGVNLLNSNLNNSSEQKQGDVSFKLENKETGNQISVKNSLIKQKNRYKNTVGTEDQEITEKKERDDSAEKYSIENMIERNLEDINWKLKKLETLNGVNLLNSNLNNSSEQKQGDVSFKLENKETGNQISVKNSLSKPLKKEIDLLSPHYSGDSDLCTSFQKKNFFDSIKVTNPSKAVKDSCNISENSNSLYNIEGDEALKDDIFANFVPKYNTKTQELDQFKADAFKDKSVNRSDLQRDNRERRGINSLQNSKRHLHIASGALDEGNVNDNETDKYSEDFDNFSKKTVGNNNVHNTSLQGLWLDNHSESSLKKLSSASKAHTVINTPNNQGEAQKATENPSESQNKDDSNILYQNTAVFESKSQTNMGESREKDQEELRIKGEFSDSLRKIMDRASPVTKEIEIVEEEKIEETNEDAETENLPWI